jgi:nucleotide-binding universal stress UspA family protein
VFKHILCPIDGSQGSLRALDVAAEFAAEQGAALTILMVVDPSRAAAMAFGDPAMTGACLDAIDDEGALIVREASGHVAATVDARPATITGQPVPSIVDYAASNSCDLIVMGSHGRGGIQRAFLGSIAEGVLRHANVPVLVIRWSQHDEKAHAMQTAATTH